MARSARSARRVLAAVDRWDVAAGHRVAATPTPAAIEIGLPLLTRAADRSLLWTVLAGGLAATGRSPLRRAAARGLASIAVSSVLANQVGKRAVRRPRPLLHHVPRSRHARLPSSSSFPSGHAASAAAFAVGAAIEAPALAVPLGALAGAVAFSRVYTGVHFSSDVLAGAALGAAVAAAGSRVLPQHDDAPPRGDEPADPQPPRPTGAGLVVVVNTVSGSADGGLAALLASELPDAQVVALHDGQDVRAALEEAAARAEVLGVAGGDGTINCAASVAMAAGLPLLVVPGGTFNHFARDLGLGEAADSVAALRAGHAVRIDVGEVDGEPFLNTASLGSYPRFVHLRERWERQLGKTPAAVLAMARVLREGAAVEVEVDGVPRRLLLLFVGNGDYRPRGFLPRGRPSLATGRLDVRLADASRRGAALRLLAATLTADLYRAPDYRETRCDRLTVRFTGERTLLARDGEVCEPQQDAPGTVTFSVRRGAVTVYRAVGGTAVRAS